MEADAWELIVPGVSGTEWRVLLVYAEPEHAGDAGPVCDRAEWAKAYLSSFCLSPSKFDPQDVLNRLARIK